MTLLTKELRDSFAASIGSVNESRLLPPVIYTSPEFYEFERQAVFQREWLCVGRVDQVPQPGDFRCITLAGEPLILLRDGDGEIGVISAVCQHRGMVLAEGSGRRTRRFTCPYHHWSYGLDGALLGAPAMERAVGFEQVRPRPAAPAHRTVAGIRVLQPGRRGAAAGPDACARSTTSWRTSGCRTR